MLVYLCFQPTPSYHTQRRTQRIIFLSLSVAKVANDRVGSGEFVSPLKCSVPLYLDQSDGAIIYLNLRATLSSVLV